VSGLILPQEVEAVFDQEAFPEVPVVLVQVVEFWALVEELDLPASVSPALPWEQLRPGRSLLRHP
jgi:hypothetical protein